MNRVAFISVVTVVLLALAGCGKHIDTQQEIYAKRAAFNQFVDANKRPQSFDGVFREVGGESGQPNLLQLFKDGGCIAPNGTGLYVMDGDAIHLTLDDEKSVDGRKVSNDQVILTIDGKERKFYREGQPFQAAYTKLNMPKPALSPDRSIPLDRYTPLQDRDMALLVAAAFRQKPLSDEEKLDLLDVGRKTTDSFARHDLMVKDLPALTRRLKELSGQRYYKTAMTNVRPTGSIADSYLRVNPDFRLIDPWLKHYDLAQKAFPAYCISESVFTFGKAIYTGWRPWEHMQMSVNEERQGLPRSHPDCLVAVPDEAAARKIEALFQRPNGVNAIRGIFYYFVVGTKGPMNSWYTVDIVFTHVDLSILDEDNETEVAKVSINL